MRNMSAINCCLGKVFFSYHTLRCSFLLAGLFLFKCFKQDFLCFMFFVLISVFFKSDVKFDEIVYFKRKQLTLLNSAKLETVRRTRCSSQLYHIFFESTSSL